MNIDARVDTFIDELIRAPGALPAFRQAVDAYRTGDMDESLRLTRLISTLMWEGSRTDETLPVLTTAVAAAVGSAAFGPDAARRFRRIS